MREFAWKSAVDCGKFPLNKKEVSALGWVSLPAGAFALKTVSGSLYRPNEDAETPEQAWVRCNDSGELLSKTGKPVKHLSEICCLTIDAMSQQCQIKPAGVHFFNPEEEIVDALRCFRQGMDYRAHLLITSPLLYDIAKALDQAAIDRCYEPTKDYAGLVRSPNGALVENISANQKELKAFENSFETQ
jgi:hypothetical protein